MYEESDDCRKKNIERRRETSRFAARDRRGKEADIFSDLKDEVPIVHDATVTHVDRIALLRVAATFCRLRKCAAEVLKTRLERERTDVWSEDAVLECLDGFVILSDSDGTILYVSESVTLYLGLTQTDLTGRNLREFMHPSDYDEFVRLNGEMSGSEDRSVGENIVLRMKTVISPRGRNLNLKGALFKPVSFLVRVMHSDGNAISLLQGCTVPAGQGSVSATANAITKNGESPNGTFMTRHTCDMRISYVSDTFNFILKNDARSLMGCSFYELVHPSDAHIVHKSIRELFQKGHVRTPFYRLVAANNNLAWVMTEATTINHTTRGQKGQYVICIHYVLGIQGEDESLVICTDSQPAGMPVLKMIKSEMDIQDSEDMIGKELVGRQPAILECFDFTPLVAPMDEPMRSPNGRNTRHSSPDSRKTSYDAVLQWLFRDRPSSPAPQYGGMGKGEGHDNGPALPIGQNTLAQNGNQQRGRARRSDEMSTHPNSVPSISRGRTDSFGSIHRGGDISREERIQAARTGARGSVGSIGQHQRQQQQQQQQQLAFSPLADGLAECALRSPQTALSPQHPRSIHNKGDIQSSAIAGSSGIDTATHGPRSIPTIPSNGAQSLCSPVERGSLLSTLSSAITPSKQPPQTTTIIPSSQSTNDPYREHFLQERADAVNKALADLDFPFEDLRSVAPFVPQEELQPISDSVAKDFQTLFPDLPDWTPTEPVASAGRMARVEEEQDEPASKRVFFNAPPPSSFTFLHQSAPSSHPQSNQIHSQIAANLQRANQQNVPPSTRLDSTMSSLIDGFLPMTPPMFYPNSLNESNDWMRAEVHSTNPNPWTRGPNSSSSSSNPNQIQVHRIP